MNGGFGFAFPTTGACGSCPSSTTTMKMGIEKVLKEKFGDAIKDICQVYDEQVTENTVEVSFVCPELFSLISKHIMHQIDNRHLYAYILFILAYIRRQ